MSLWRPVVEQLGRYLAMAPSKNSVPDRWLDYDDLGGTVPGTRFVPFKVPLRELISIRVPPERRFTPNDVLQRLPDLGLVIDLTCTDRYYDPRVMVSHGIIHTKIRCAGQLLPNRKVVKNFTRAVDAFATKPANDGKLIGVHCTHGVNRTGYLVCRYMIGSLGIAPATAIEQFQNARGHQFDRQEYVKDLYGRFQ
ncbi:RNA/RNP complex-1-interacting phosphatase-like [Amblyomma americanum]